MEIRNLNLDSKRVRSRFEDLDIGINEYGMNLLDSPLYAFESKEQSIHIREVSLGELGFSNGATYGQIEEWVRSSEFAYIPINFAPYIRIAYRNQKSIEKSFAGQHPPDGIIIFSKPLKKAESFPKGFYIRKIKGKLWLRGVVCSTDYHFPPDTRIILRITS